VLRYAFRVAETGFDPAQVNDIYSSNVNANIFDAPLTYELPGAPGEDSSRTPRLRCPKSLPTSHPESRFRADLECQGAKVGRDFGQRSRGVRDDLRRARQEVIRQRCVEMLALTLLE